MKTDKQSTLNLVARYAERGNPDGWFDEFYARAEGDAEQVYWADLKPGPHLLDQLRQHPTSPGARAVTIGCGLGDDAEALANHGYEVTAFDISPAAIEMCRRRFPDSQVNYQVADLFRLPASWRRSFDLVYECNTIQVLTGQNRPDGRDAMVALVRPGGLLLVSCRSRESGQGLDVWPLALDRQEIGGFERAGLNEERFLAYDDDQDPPVPHFFAVYRRPKGA